MFLPIVASFISSPPWYVSITNSIDCVRLNIHTLFGSDIYHVALDDYEHGVVIRSLNDKKTDLKKEGKSTDAVDDLIIKFGHAPKRKFKVIEKEKDCRESR